MGTCAVVAPVHNQTGEVIATLGVVVPTGRFGPEDREIRAQGGAVHGRSPLGVLRVRAAGGDGRAADRRGRDRLTVLPARHGSGSRRRGS